MFLAFLLMLQPNLPTFQETPEVKTEEFYKKELSTYEKISKNFHRPAFSYYEKFTFKNNKTKEVKKLKEMSPFDQKMVCLQVSEMLTKTLENIEKEWIKIHKDTKEPITKEVLGKLLKDMLEIRQNTATRRELFVKTFFEDYADEFSKEEAANYIQNMRKYHTDQKLVQK